MDSNIIIPVLSGLSSFIIGGGLATVVTLRSTKKKADVEVKIEEISALHATVKNVYEPTIQFQKERIIELESEVKSLKEQLSAERVDRQREMKIMNDRILAITSALGLKAATQLRNEKGQFTSSAEITEQ